MSVNASPAAEKCDACGAALQSFPCGACGGAGYQRKVLIFKTTCPLCSGSGTRRRCPNELRHIIGDLKLSPRLNASTLYKQFQPPPQWATPQNALPQLNRTPRLVRPPQIPPPWHPAYPNPWHPMHPNNPRNQPFNPLNPNSPNNPNNINSPLNPLNPNNPINQARR